MRLVSKYFSKYFLATILALLAVARPSGALPSNAPNVVASIAPIHSLVAGVMQGIGEPVLVVRGYGSPHTYQMRPSNARALNRADVIFWVGESLEPFLINPLSSLGDRARIVTLSETSDLTTYAYRAGGTWEANNLTHKHQHSHLEVDTHIWLDPDNAKKIVDNIARALSAVDPSHKSTYERNGEIVKQRIETMAQQAVSQLRPIRDRPFIVFHDAYQYLERYFELRVVGSVTIDPDQQPSARRLSMLYERIRQSQARCLFTEPQFNSALIRTITEATQINTATLDPMGTNIEPGPNAYIEMMNANVAAIVECLAR